MCFSFVYYYPRLPLAMTLHEAQYDTIPGFTTKQELVRIVEGYNWMDPMVRQTFQEVTLKSTMTEICHWVVGEYVCTNIIFYYLFISF